MNSRKIGLAVIVALVGASTPATHASSATRSESGTASREGVEAKLDGLPLYFVANHGQADERVDFYVQGSETNVYFTDKGITYQLSDRDSKKRWAVKLDFVGANRVTPEGRERGETKINYFKGPEKDWETKVPTYSGLVYRDLWDGIDLVYSGTASSLKQTFVVHPGADPDDIRLAYRGATSVTETASGAIRVKTPVGGFTDARPHSFQRDGGERTIVESAYELGRARKKTRVYGFEVGDYDPTRALVIDPEVVVYAGYLGGSSADQGFGIAVDGAGAAYVTGVANSTQADFPASGGPDLAYNGRGDAFVAKVAPGGGSLVYAGYIGGAGADQGLGIAVDGAGAAYVAGQTASSQPGFPVVGGPDVTFNGASDAFVAKVAPDGGSLVYAGYVGGSASDVANGIAVDGTGAAYVAGNTNSSSFPVAGGPDLTHNGNTEGFVAKVAPSGGSLVYAGYIGGSAFDQAFGIAVDGAGAAYVSGHTTSRQVDGFPVAVGPDVTHNGGLDAFVTKVDPSGMSFVYSGYIGGTASDAANGVAVDASGAAYVAGFTTSTQPSGFPVTGGPGSVHNGNEDAFVAKVSPDGGALVYAGYVGGGNDDRGQGIAVDGTGAAYVTGRTASSEASFPVTAGPDLSHNGGTDAFVAKVAPGGGSLVYAGYVGGLGTDIGYGVAVDGAGAAYVTGETTSSEATFPVATGPDVSHNGGNDAFVAKIGPSLQDLGVSTAGAGSGKVTSSPEGIDCGTDCTQDYAHGTSVTLDATPSADSVFAGWSGGGCSGTGTCTVTMDAAKAVTATFEIAQRTLTVAKNGGGTGTVTSSPGGVDCGADCTQDYAHGTSVTLAAAPAADSAFAGWSGGGCSGTGTCTVTMDAAKAVTATFEIAQRTLTVAKNGDGTGTVTSSPGGVDCGADCTEDYAHGTLVTLTVTPAPGSIFVGWSGICTGSGACAITMDAAKTVTANFARIPRPSRTLTVDKSGGGEGEVTSSPMGIHCGSDCAQVYEDGMTITLTATPEGLSGFGSWSGCDRATGNECVVTMNVDTTVTARFLAPRSLTVEREGTGSGEVTSTPGGIDCGGQCQAEYVNGSEVVLTAIPGAGSTFGSWSGCDRVSDDECTVALTSDATVTARFDGARVVHERRVSLFLGRHLVAHGRVWVGDGPVACAAGVPVRIQRKTAKGWVTERRRLTSEQGKFRVRLVDRSDSYRVRAPAIKIDGGPDACKNAVSPVREHGHE